MRHMHGATRQYARVAQGIGAILTLSSYQIDLQPIFVTQRNGLHNFDPIDMV